MNNELMRLMLDAKKNGMIEEYKELKKIFIEETEPTEVCEECGSKLEYVYDGKDMDGKRAVCTTCQPGKVASEADTTIIDMMLEAKKTGNMDEYKQLKKLYIEEDEKASEELDTDDKGMEDNSKDLDEGDTDEEPKTDNFEESIDKDIKESLDNTDELKGAIIKRIEYTETDLTIETDKGNYTITIVDTPDLKYLYIGK